MWAVMLLFYSDHCGHCRMLLETIKRHDSKGYVKLVSVDALAASGRSVPPQVHSVPCLVVVEDERRKCLFGKQVFDYLLLPGRGKLVSGKLGGGPAPGGAGPPSAASTDVALAPGEPMAFAINTRGFGDAFTSLEEDGTHAALAPRPDRAFHWTTIHDHEQGVVPTDVPLGEETRSKKGLPDMDTIRSMRDADLESDLRTNPHDPPTFTR